MTTNTHIITNETVRIRQLFFFHMLPLYQQLRSQLYLISHLHMLILTHQKDVFLHEQFLIFKYSLFSMVYHTHNYFPWFITHTITCTKISWLHFCIFPYSPNFFFVLLTVHSFDLSPFYYNLFLCVDRFLLH